jgi:Na+/H+-dicarboxylate symporter
MNVSVILLGIILPFYSIIDMIETALNVWSDSCVAIMVNEDVKEMQDNQTSNSLEGIEI